MNWDTYVQRFKKENAFMNFVQNPVYGLVTNEPTNFEVFARNNPMSQAFIPKFWIPRGTDDSLVYIFLENAVSPCRFACHEEAFPPRNIRFLEEQ